MMSTFTDTGGSSNVAITSALVPQSDRRVRNVTGLCELVKEATAERDAQERALDAVQRLRSDLETAFHQFLVDERTKVINNWEVLEDISRELLLQRDHAEEKQLSDKERSQEQKKQILNNRRDLHQVMAAITADLVVAEEKHRPDIVCDDNTIKPKDWSEEAIAALRISLQRSADVERHDIPDVLEDISTWIDSLRLKIAEHNVQVQRIEAMNTEREFMIPGLRSGPFAQPPDTTMPEAHDDGAAERKRKTQGGTAWGMQGTEHTMRRGDDGDDDNGDGGEDSVLFTLPLSPYQQRKLVKRIHNVEEDCARWKRLAKKREKRMQAQEHKSQDTVGDLHRELKSVKELHKSLHILANTAGRSEKETMDKLDVLHSKLHHRNDYITQLVQNSKRKEDDAKKLQARTEALERELQEKSDDVARLTGELRALQSGEETGADGKQHRRKPVSYIEHQVLEAKLDTLVFCYEDTLETNRMLTQENRWLRVFGNLPHSALGSVDLQDIDPTDIDASLENVSEDTINEAIEACEVKDAQYVSVDEFLALCRHIVDGARPDYAAVAFIKDTLQQIFSAILDGSNREEISSNDLKKGFERARVVWTREKLDVLITTADSNDDGSLTFTDFYCLCRGLDFSVLDREMLSQLHYKKQVPAAFFSQLYRLATFFQEQLRKHEEEALAVIRAKSQKKKRLRRLKRKQKQKQQKQKQKQKQKQSKKGKRKGKKGKAKSTSESKEANTSVNDNGAGSGSSSSGSGTGSSDEDDGDDDGGGFGQDKMEFLLEGERGRQSLHKSKRATALVFSRAWGSQSKTLTKASTLLNERRNYFELLKPSPSAQRRRLSRSSATPTITKRRLSRNRPMTARASGERRRFSFRHTDQRRNQNPPRRFSVRSRADSTAVASLEDAKRVLLRPANVRDVAIQTGEDIHSDAFISLESEVALSGLPVWADDERYSFREVKPGESGIWVRLWKLAKAGQQERFRNTLHSFAGDCASRARRRPSRRNSRKPSVSSHQAGSSSRRGSSVSVASSAAAVDSGPYEPHWGYKTVSHSSQLREKRRIITTITSRRPQSARMPLPQPPDGSTPKQAGRTRTSIFKQQQQQQHQQQGNNSDSSSTDSSVDSDEAI